MIIASNFYYNRDSLSEKEDFDLLSYGAALVFSGSKLMINSTLAHGNTGLKGAFLLIEQGYSSNVAVWIGYSLFRWNLGRNGPAYCLGENLQNFRMIVTNNFFTKNYGWGKHFFVPFSYNDILIFEDGGVGYIKFSDKSCEYTFQNNFLFRNKAVVGGTFFYQLFFGNITLLQNCFLENWGFSIVGMGGCFSCFATDASLILLIRNKILFHLSDYVGTIACSGGRLNLFYNLFYGLDKFIF